MTQGHDSEKGQGPVRSESNWLFAQDVALPHINQGNVRDFFPEMIGRSTSMLRVYETISKIARSDGAVLIQGESGTGKELVAAALHRLSPRADKRFIAINCSAIPENLLESELFGHEKGAFTSADRRRVGHFEAATGGTIFLDEIGDMPASLQAKLLRVLQEKRFTPLGGNELKKADVRIIAATNIDLEKAVHDGRFRLDLYYRLNVLPIALPPLRERQDDIPQLVEYFLELAQRNHPMSNVSCFTVGAIQRMKSYEWPGNVRELQNLIERLVVLNGGGEIGEEQLPQGIAGVPAVAVPPVASVLTTNMAIDKAAPLMARPSALVRMPNDSGTLPETGIDLQSFIESLENSLITQALSRTQNNKNQAAKLLGLNRTTLVERIKKRGIVTPSGISVDDDNQ